MTLLQPPPVALLDKYRGQAFEAVYSTSVTVCGGATRNGRASGVARSNDGLLDLDLRLPEQLGGQGGGTNPEQLFAAAYAACFHGALMLIAAKRRIPVADASVTTVVVFGRDPVDGLFMLTADVSIALPDVERRLAQELVRHAERLCPYAKMARNGFASVVALAP